MIFLGLKCFISTSTNVHSITSFSPYSEKKGHEVSKNTQNLSHLNEEQQANFGKDVNSARMGAKLQGFETIKCFSTFQVMVFSPENMTIKAFIKVSINYMDHMNYSKVMLLL